MTISQASTRSSSPLASASNAVVWVSSVTWNQQGLLRERKAQWPVPPSQVASTGHCNGCCPLTPCLNPDIHLCFRWVRNCVAAEFDIGTNHVHQLRGDSTESEDPYFLLIKYRNALPRVWSSFSIWNETAVSVAPGNCRASVNRSSLNGRGPGDEIVGY